ncbi:MAG: type I-C CRISPR-associated protein Cas5 [Peptococcaceae bacterium]|nr:MAG: type I-C CRISPR-associated protein Cas5 [Peptococcaceae bacterium]
MENYAPLEVKVWGSFACFTRPEMKAERVTYPVMTPSAARGVLEAIFWRPEFSWQVREIRVLKDIQHISLLRNEVNSTAVVSTARRWVVNDGGYYAEEDRAQRHTLALRDVAYLIKADVSLRSHADAHVAKYRDMFRRRVQRGQCHHQPYLGCREFSAFFALPLGDERPVDFTDDLGRILFDLDFLPDGSGRAVPRFFNARMEKGVLRIPSELYSRREG